MKKWNLIIDVAGCENCNNCVLATKDELDGNRFEGYTVPHPKQGRGVLWLERKVRGAEHMVDTAYLPSMCMHCDDGPCLKAGADGSVRKREDGIVVIDPIKSKGRRDLVDACPYGAIVWNELEMVPQNWFFDAHLLDQGWAAPRCVGVCPTGAIEAVALKDEDMQSQVKSQGLSVFRPELKTRPRVFYRNLFRFNSAFIAASASVVFDDKPDCAEGIQVTLSHEGRVVASELTDAYGDVKFDGLAPSSGEYLLTFLSSDRELLTVPVTLGAESVYAGDVQLTIPLG